jgi:DNA-binding transcriptional MerR regulator
VADLVIVEVRRLGQFVPEFAQCAGVNIQTLRYYERRRLLPSAVRSPSGQRRYPAATVDLVPCIKGAQRLDFPLDEIDELLTLPAHRKNTEELRRRASLKIAEIDARIANLR